MRMMGSALVIVDRGPLADITCGGEDSVRVGHSYGLGVGLGSHFVLRKIIRMDGAQAPVPASRRLFVAYVGSTQEEPQSIKSTRASASGMASGSPVNTLINYPPCEQISSKKPPVYLFF